MPEVSLCAADTRALTFHLGSSPLVICSGRQHSHLSPSPQGSEPPGWGPQPLQPPGLWDNRFSVGLLTHSPVPVLRPAHHPQIGRGTDYITDDAVGGQGGRHSKEGCSYVCSGLGIQDLKRMYNIRWAVNVSRHRAKHLASLSPCVFTTALWGRWLLRRY